MTKSATRQAFDCADVAVAVDRQQLTIIQQDVGLIAPVAIELDNRIALLDQRVGQSLTEIGLARHQTREILSALRAINKAKHAAARGLIEYRALAVHLMLND